MMRGVHGGCASRSSNTTTLSVSGTNEKKSYDPKKRNTPIQDRTALSLNNSNIKVCDHDHT